MTANTPTGCSTRTWIAPISYTSSAKSVHRRRSTRGKTSGQEAGRTRTGGVDAGGLFAHCLEDHPFLALAVPLAIEDSLPRAKVEVTARNGNDDLVPDRE